MEQLSGILFVCKFCAKPVFVTDERDKRRVFCCKECEKKFWKKNEGSRRLRTEKAEKRFVELERALTEYLDTQEQRN